MTEADIMHENGSFWVGRERTAYVVYSAGITCSISDSAYERSSDGLSIAIARCDYLSSASMANKPAELF